MQKTTGYVSSIDDLPLNLDQAECLLVKRALALSEGNVSEAARLLDVSRMKVYRILAKGEPSRKACFGDIR